jgi:hypothetical protein
MPTTVAIKKGRTYRVAGRCSLQAMRAAGRAFGRQPLEEHQLFEEHIVRDFLKRCFATGA